MADAAATEYQGATLWFLFTGFTRPEYKVIDGQPYYLAATYIAEGLLDRIQQKHLPLHVLDRRRSRASAIATIPSTIFAMQHPEAGDVSMCDCSEEIQWHRGTGGNHDVVERSLRQAKLGNQRELAVLLPANTVEDLETLHGTPLPFLPVQLDLWVPKWRVSGVSAEYCAPLRCRDRTSKSSSVRNFEVG